MTKMTPTKKALWQMVCFEHKDFTQAACALKVDCKTASNTYHKLLGQGAHPDFYKKAPGCGHPHSMTAREEQRAILAIHHSHAHTAMDLQCDMFPHLHPTTVHAYTPLPLWEGMPQEAPSSPHPSLSAKEVGEDVQLVDCRDVAASVVL